MAAQKLRRTQLTLAPYRGPPEARFKVLQWNVLADGLAQHGDFVKVRPCACMQAAERGEYRKGCMEHACMPTWHR
jgi:hypothetical protein